MKKQNLFTIHASLALRLSLCLLALCLSLFSCRKTKTEKAEEVIEEPAGGTTKGRVVLVYMAAENSLASYTTADVNEILTGAQYLGAKDHVLVYLDNTANPRIFDITYRQAGKRLSDITPVQEYSPDHDSCTPEVFSAVLDYMVQNYPAASYGLVLWSHGSGWIPPLPVSVGDYSSAWGSKRRVSSQRRSFGFDNQQNSADTNGGSQLSINQLRDVILQHTYFDFIFFDACFMQNIETAYQLRNCAHYIIGSSAEIPAYGAPYHTVLQYMFQDTDYAAGMVQAYYDGYQGQTFYGVLLSAIDCSRLEEVARFTRPYVQQYKQRLLDMDYDGVQNYFWWDDYYRFNYPDYYDMQGLMRTALSAEDYQQWQPQFRQLFVAQAHSRCWYSAFNNRATNTVDDEQYSGISMHVPLYKYAARNKWFAPAYYETDWAKAVWAETPTE